MNIKSLKEIEKTINLIKKLDTHKKVKLIIIYGSYLTKKQTPISDIDLSIYYDGPKKERFDFRIKILGQSKDIFDIQILQDLPLYIQKDIIGKGKIVYKKEEKRMNEILINMIRNYESFKKHYDLYLNSLEGAKIA